MDTQVKLEHEVSFRWLIVFALPTILSSIFSSLYSTVDGIFIARLVDTDALSAINITMPMIFLASAIGMMFGSGGNALVAKKLGEGKQREAQEDFSLLMAVAFIFSVVLAALCFAFLNPLCYFLGSDQALLHYCREYMIPVLITLPFAVFGMVFQLSFITVGKAGFGYGWSPEYCTGLAVYRDFSLGTGRRCCSRFFCKKQRPGGDDRTVWIPDRGNQLPDDGLQRICIRLVHCIKRWKNICDLIFLPNCHFHDRAGTDTARDLWHGWSMDVHYSW